MVKHVNELMKGRGRKSKIKYDVGTKIKFGKRKGKPYVKSTIKKF